MLKFGGSLVSFMWSVGFKACDMPRPEGDVVLKADKIEKQNKDYKYSSSHSQFDCKPSFYQNHKHPVQPPG